MPPKPRLRNTGGSAKGGKQFARLTLEEDTLTPTLKALPHVIDGIIALTLNYYEPKMENHAKLNAPWEDQTSNARNGLAARSGKEGKTRFIVLFHQVPYGIYLETRWSGKYAIIMPTIEEFGPQVMDTFQKILEKRFPGGPVS
jgi:hypothetical protein